MPDWRMLFGLMIVPVTLLVWALVVSAILWAKGEW